MPQEGQGNKLHAIFLNEDGMSSAWLDCAVHRLFIFRKKPSIAYDEGKMR